MATSFVGPFFSYPYNELGEVEDLLMDATVHERLAQLFTGLTKKTKVRGALYIWLYEDFGVKQGQMNGPMVSSPRMFTEAVHQSLVRSGAKDVRFIVDQRYMTPDTRNAFDEKHLDVTEDAAGGKMHSKFFLFSDLKFAPGNVPDYPSHMKYVVAVTSANVDNAMYRAANNLVVMHGNKSLFEAFLQLWEYILAHPAAQAEDAVSTACNDVYMYSFPRSSDTIVRILEKVNERMGSDPKPPCIRVAMYLFSREAVRDWLIQLAENGADVKVVLTSYNHKNKPRNRELENELDEHGVPARLIPNRTVGVMHSKYLLVDAQYELSNETARRRIVWTGSHNYTYAALEENDEVLIRLVNPMVYQSYLDDWDRLWRLAGQ